MIQSRCQLCGVFYPPWERHDCPRAVTNGMANGPVVTNNVTNADKPVTNALGNAERQRKHRERDREAYNAKARERMRRKRAEARS